MSRPTYLWRKLTPKQREELMAWRKRQGLPWHRPPHRVSEKTRYHVTAACFEHRPHIGWGEERMRSFCDTLLGVFKGQNALIHAWCVLPNHYHALIETNDIPELLSELGRMHGRLSFLWNNEENTRGRQVWCGAAERYMRNESHFWATMNYVHNNPVHHGYVRRWQDWPFSSAEEYLAEMGRESVEKPGAIIRFGITGRDGTMRNCEKYWHAKACTPNGVGVWCPPFRVFLWFRHAEACTPNK